MQEQHGEGRRILAQGGGEQVELAGPPHERLRAAASRADSVPAGAVSFPALGFPLTR